MPKEKILIVEDEKNISKLIRYNLEKAEFETVSARSGEEALRILSKHEVNLVLLDIMLPGMDGLEVCRTIKQNKATARIPVIMLTAKGEEVDRVVGFEIGADDYITKPFSPRELVLRIKAILKRGRVETHSKEILTAGGVTIDVPKHRVMVKEKIVELTHTEFKLLFTLIERRGRVQTRENLLSDIWGIDTLIETRTVDTHIKSLRSKLGKEGKKVETVRGIGYKFNDSDEA
jgi:two-component system, OmpR family, phosphate regulon response regulator PhoB